MKLFGPTSYSAKRSDLFRLAEGHVRSKESSSLLPKNRRCVRKKMKVRLKKTAGPLESAFACVFW